MRARNFLAAIAAAALLWAAPLISQSVLADKGKVKINNGHGGWGGGYAGKWDGGDWDDDDYDGNWNGGYIGPGALSIGPRGFSIGVRPFSYGYGPYASGYSYGYPQGSYGYRGGYRSYGGYEGGDYSVQPGITIQPGMSYSDDVQAAYEGLGVTIRNHTDAELNFTIDDRRQMRIAPGETTRLTEKGQFLISFDRGSDFGSARYAIHEGVYAFTPTDGGWELYRQKGDDAVADRPNPSVIPRTVERPRVEELPRPRDSREFEDRSRQDSVPMQDKELPPLPRPY